MDAQGQHGAWIEHVRLRNSTKNPIKEENGVYHLDKGELET